MFCVCARKALVREGSVPLAPERRLQLVPFTAETRGVQWLLRVPRLGASSSPSSW